MKSFGMRRGDYGYVGEADKPASRSRARRLAPILDDWEDKGHDTAGDPVESRAFCWPCLGTGAKCLAEGCGCCPRCNATKVAA